MRIKNILILIVISVLVAGCGHYNTTPDPTAKAWDGDVVYASYAIVNKLENNIRVPISQDAPIIVASFVNVSDLTKSSAFGRIMSEQVGSRFAQKGYKVIEMKLRQNSIFVDQENKGEFLLSRNIKDISVAHEAAVVVVGTYAQGYDKVYVSARMVNPIDSVIMSSCDYELDFPEYNELMSLMRE